MSLFDTCLTGLLAEGAVVGAREPSERDAQWQGLVGLVLCVAFESQPLPPSLWLSPPLIFLIGGCSQLASLRAHNFVYAAKGYAGHFCLWTTHSEVAFWSKTQVLHVSKNLLSSTLAAFAAGSVVFLVGAMDSSHALASG